MIPSERSIYFKCLWVPWSTQVNEKKTTKDKIIQAHDEMITED